MKKKKIQLKRMLPLIFVLALMAVGYLLAYFYPPTRNSLREIYLTAKNFNELHPVGAPLLFMTFYTLSSLISLPGIFILSIIAGFLFIEPLCTLYVTVASTIGASLIFWAARSAFGEFYYKKPPGFLNQLEKGFQENAASYMLFLRLVPFFPFFAVNLACGLSQVPFRTFAWTTFIGMIPSVWIYTEAGREIVHLLENSSPLTPFDVLNFKGAAVLSGLALLALLPVLSRKIYLRKQKNPLPKEDLRFWQRILPRK